MKVGPGFHLLVGGKMVAVVVIVAFVAVVDAVVVA